MPCRNLKTNPRQRTVERAARRPWLRAVGAAAHVPRPGRDTGMLILTRKRDESIIIGDHIRVTVVGSRATR